MQSARLEEIRIRNFKSFRDVHFKDLRGFKRLIGERGQIELARRIGPHMALADNNCPSFRTLVHSIKGDW